MRAADPPPEGAAEKQPETAAEETSPTAAEQLKTAAKSKRWYAKPAAMAVWVIGALGLIKTVLSGTQTALDNTQKILDFFGVQLGEKKGQIVLEASPAVHLDDRDVLALAITKKSRAPLSNCCVEAWIGPMQGKVLSTTERFGLRRVQPVYDS